MPPEHMVYVWWYWSSDDGEFESLDIDFTIHNDIVDFTAPYGLYLMLGYAEISGVPFYFGLQTDVDDPASGSRGKGLIFSRWETRDLDNAGIADPEDGWSQSSGHEGDFIGVRRSYDWGAGDYRVRIAPDGSDDGGRFYRQERLQRRTTVRQTVTRPMLLGVSRTRGDRPRCLTLCVDTGRARHTLYWS